MGFESVLGQRAAVKTLTAALASGRRHHAYRFEGPEGTGKELAAFAFAQALVCEAPTPLGCGQCSACKRAVSLSEDEPIVPLHPDVLLLGKGVYPASVLGKAELTAIGVEQVRKVVLSRVGFRPHEARHLVFIVRDADLFTPPAANALLKTLEEPDPAVQFLILTSRPHRLLDTIRSRTLAVRFAPLGDQVVAEILRARGLDESWASLSQGSASRALELASADAAGTHEAFQGKVREALTSKNSDATLDLAAALPKDRNALRSLLLGLAQQLATSAERFARGDRRGSPRASMRYQLVLEAMDALERNAQPQLVMETLLLQLRQA